MRLRLKNQLGDTIVEVLIAMAVTSLILGGAYAVAQHSFGTVRDSQERGEALSLAQAQLEQLINAAGNPKLHDTLFGQSSVFCFANGGPSTQNASSTIVPAYQGVYPPNVADDLDLTKYTDTDGSGNPYKGCRYSRAGGGNDYYTATEFKKSGPNIYTYTVHERWDRVGSGKDELTLSYRIYK